jgi:PAS domain S-box-containing protein
VSNMEGSLRNVEARFRMRDGQIRIGLASAELIEIDGERCLLSVTSDITELRQAQEARLRYAAIVESSNDAIVSKNLDGIIVSWNAATERLFGYSSAEAVGRPITILIPSELRDEESVLFQRLRVGGRVEHYETVRIAKSGMRVPVSLTISQVIDSVGKIIGFSQIARDITDRKRAEQVLRESEERFRLVADMLLC